MHDDKYDIPEDVPNWYLFKQNRKIQTIQIATIGFIGFTIALVSAAELGLATEAVFVISAIGGFSIYGLTFLKIYAAKYDGVARRLCEWIGIGTVANAKAKIAERRQTHDRKGAD